MIALIAGIIVSPHATNFIHPLDFAEGSTVKLEYITLYFTRLVLGVQLVIAGIQLPHKYLKKEWWSLMLLLGPAMTAMWISASLLIWAMVPHLPFVHALACGACVTPTDPILSNSIVKGKFADKTIPKGLQRIIIAESGANDGLGYPFLFIALYIIKYTQYGGMGEPDAGKAVEQWFVETWFYTIFMSVAYGVLVGWGAKELLHFAEERKFVDRESFIVFAITIALFITGTCGMIGSDDVLACFIAGNAFTWDDWFRQETEDDTLQPTIDMLLNLSIFMWFGATAPWANFRVNDVMPIYRLIFLGILILLFRRLPIILALHRWIPHIEEFQQALFVGFFGPIGVSAIFYLYISIDFLDKVNPGGELREDAAHLQQVMRVVIWFLAICSIVVHGLSVPIGKLGYHLPRTMSQALTTSQEREEEPHMLHHHVSQMGQNTGGGYQMRKRRKNDRQPSTGAFKIGGSTMPPAEGAEANGTPVEPERPVYFPDTERNTPTGAGARTPTDDSPVDSSQDSAWDLVHKQEAEQAMKNKKDVDLEKAV